MLTDLRIGDYALDSKTHVVEADGQIDLFSAPLLKERVWHAIDAGATRLVVDLSQVTFMDSTGLGVVVGARKRLLQTKGALSLVVTSGEIERLFELTGLDGTFDLYESRDEALEALSVAPDL